MIHSALHRPVLMAGVDRGLAKAMAAALSLGLGWMGGALSWALLGRLREHRTEPAGLCDWLLWAYLVGEGVVLGKDGSLLTGWSYRGPEIRAQGLKTARQLADVVEGQ